MEIIMRDERIPKNCYECSYLNYCSLNPDFKPTISKCPLKPLSQHDKETRNKVIDELLDFIEITINSPIETIKSGDETQYIHAFDLQQKLNKMRGIE